MDFLLKQILRHVQFLKLLFLATPSPRSSNDLRTNEISNLSGRKITPCGRIRSTRAGITTFFFLARVVFWGSRLFFSMQVVVFGGRDIFYNIFVTFFETF